MPREFPCPSCDRPIRTYMMVGEEATCGDCRVRTLVPEGAAEIGAPLAPKDSKPRASKVPLPKILVVTTPSVEGSRVVEHFGFVSGEAVIGTDIFRDLAASITDVVGGRSGAYEGRLQEARALAVYELSERAEEMGANAVVGVDMEYAGLGSAGSLLMVVASGTAVFIEREPASV